MIIFVQKAGGREQECEGKGHGSIIREYLIRTESHQ
jgi:hypothetical protein